MLSTRVIPCLLLRGRGLFKTKSFKEPKYLGDPRNVVRIFNEKEVDELILLDILSTVNHEPIQFELIHDIVSEAFMPVAYGGGIKTMDDAQRLIGLGIEKIVLNTNAVENPGFVEKAARVIGSQSVVVCIDAKKNIFGRYDVYTHGGRKRVKTDPISLARDMERMGAGEIVIQSMERDGMMTGYDLDLVRQVSSAVRVPVIACGGAGNLNHFTEVVNHGGASAVAAGSMFVFQGKHRAVLISYPDYIQLKESLYGVQK